MPTPSSTVPNSPAVADPFDHEGMLNRFLNPAFIRDARLGHDRQTVLMQAAQNGDAELLRFVLPHSDVLAIDGKGVAAIHFAAAKGRTECVRLLMEKNAEEQCDMVASVEYSKHMDPVDHAITNGHWDCVKILAPHAYLADRLFSSISAQKLYPLQEAARSERADMLAFLAPFCSPERARGRGDNGQLSEHLRKVARENFDDCHHPSRLLEILANRKTPEARECARAILSDPNVRIRRDKRQNNGGAFFKAIGAENPAMATLLAPHFGVNEKQGLPDSGEGNPLWDCTPIAWALRKNATSCLDALLPLCDASLSETTYYTSVYHTNSGYVSAPHEALALALSMDKAPTASAGEKERQWGLADRILARCVELRCDLSPMREYFSFLGKPDDQAPAWERLPRFRAQLEVDGLREALNEAAEAIRPVAAEQLVKNPAANEPPWGDQEKSATNGPRSPTRL